MREVVDLTRLAIADALQGGATRARLAVLAVRLDEGTRQTLERILREFASPEHPGPRAFCSAVRAAVSGRLVEEWGDGEEQVARVAAGAVKRLLRAE